MNYIDRAINNSKCFLGFMNSGIVIGPYWSYGIVNG
jgi:hypothetical protein